jgi:hypothetical protein
MDTVFKTQEQLEDEKERANELLKNQSNNSTVEIGEA